MPKEKTVTKERLIEAAVRLVEREGEAALTARAVAAEAGASTKPIYAAFPSMSDLNREVKEVARARFRACIERAGRRYEPLFAYAMGYLAFAAEEPRLFSLLFLCPGEEETDDGRLVSAIARSLGIGEREARRRYTEMRVYLHGLATLSATGRIRYDAEEAERTVREKMRKLENSEL